MRVEGLCQFDSDRVSLQTLPERQIVDSFLFRDVTQNCSLPISFIDVMEKPRSPIGEDICDEKSKYSSVYLA